MEIELARALAGKWYKRSPDPKPSVITLRVDVCVGRSFRATGEPLRGVLATARYVAGIQAPRPSRLFIFRQQCSPGLEASRNGIAPQVPILAQPQF
jgi:hypothetical protein